MHRAAPVLTVAAALLLTGCSDSGTNSGVDIPVGAAATSEPAEPVEVTAELTDPEGSVIGSVTAVDTANGSEIEVEAVGMTTGLHPVELREVADCTSSGGSFGATGSPLDAPGTTLPGLAVDGEGVGSLTSEAGIALESLLDDDGTAVVVTGVEAPDGAGLPGTQQACAAITG